MFYLLRYCERTRWSHCSSCLFLLPAGQEEPNAEDEGGWLKYGGNGAAMSEAKIMQSLLLDYEENETRFIGEDVAFHDVQGIIIH